MKSKIGDITQLITLVVALAILVITIVYIINMITPFVWYQKLQNVAAKYVYVIERFGYLTVDEKEELYKELETHGFNVDNILLECPTCKLEYGEMFKFDLTYKLKIEYGMIYTGLKRETKEVLIHVEKYGYSKV